MTNTYFCRETGNVANTCSFGLVFTQILLRYLSQKMTGKASDEETQKLFDIEGGDPGFVAWPSQLSLHCSAQPDKPNTVYLFRKLLRKTKIHKWPRVKIDVLRYCESVFEHFSGGEMLSKIQNSERREARQLHPSMSTTRSIFVQQQPPNHPPAPGWKLQNFQDHFQFQIKDK